MKFIKHLLRRRLSNYIRWREIIGSKDKSAMLKPEKGEIRRNLGYGA